MAADPDDEVFDVVSHASVSSVSQTDLVIREALQILLDSGHFGRLTLLLVALDLNQQAQQLLALQATILGVLTTSQKRRRKP
jgi:hypothetical protein